MDIENISYNELEQILTARKDRIENDFNPIISLNKESLAYAFSLANFFEKRLAEKCLKEKKILAGPDGFIPIILHKANHQLLGALIVAEKGLNSAAYTLLRSAVENIQMAYFLRFTGPLAVIYFEYQTGKRAKDDDFRNKYHWFGPGYIRNTIYSKNKAESIRKVYEELSLKAHSSIKGVASDFEYSKATSEDFLKTHLLVTAAQLIVINEIYIEFVTKEKNEEIWNAVNKIGKEIGKLPDFVADSPTLPHKPTINTN